MHARRTIAATAVVVLLAACGGDDDENDELAEDPLETEEAEVGEDPEPDDEPTEDEAEAEGDAESVSNDGEDAYEVQSGDTLSSIATEFDTTVDEIMEANDLDDPDVLHVGDEIVIP